MKAARKLFAFTLLIGLLGQTLLLAVQPDEMLLSNPVREARARSVTRPAW